jgi:ABC-type transport system involved in multi-copper enzyme maturation permease subunit
MTTELLDSHPTRDIAARGRRTWSLSLWGLRTVAVLELRQRVRTSRWFLVLGAWMLVLGGITWLAIKAVYATYQGFDSTVAGMPPDGTGTATSPSAALSSTITQTVSSQAGRTAFAVVVLMVLSLGALVAPALSATSVNGDRNAGVLATLQTTLLTPAELAIGKLLAAWVVALALLAGALPFIVWALVLGGLDVPRLLVVLGVLALVLLVVCAIGLGWSAVAAKPVFSAVLTYLTVAFLGLGLPLVFVAMYPLSTSTEEVVSTYLMPVDPNAPMDGSVETPMKCVSQSNTQAVFHTERIWWILAPSPYVVLADATPIGKAGEATDPLGDIRNSARDARLGPNNTVYNQCGDGSAANRQRQVDRDALGITWPFGLAADLALGAVFVVVAVRRLRTPTRTLPRGTRVA